MYYSLEPEVAGGLGVNSLIDSTVHPPIVTRLHYHFEGWPVDDLIETFPCYIVTRRLKMAIEESSLIGFILGPVEISKSVMFDEIHPGMELPEFHWLKVNGIKGKDDFFIADDHRLVVSRKALDIFQKFTLENCDLEKYEI